MAFARSSLQLRQIRTNATGARLGNWSNRSTCETEGSALEDAEEKVARLVYSYLFGPALSRCRSHNGKGTIN